MVRHPVAMRRADLDEFDPDGAGDPRGSLFGLPFTEAESNLVLLPVPWEVTTSYGRGTAQGPAAIRAASPQLDLFDPGLAALGVSQPWQWGIHMRAEDPWVQRLDARAGAQALLVIEAGGVLGDDAELRAALEQVNAASVQLDEWVQGQVVGLLDAGKVVGVVGGDHSVALGSIEAHARRWPGLGVLQIDAHADLRVAYEGFERSHASVMGNVLDRTDVAALVQVGIRDLSAAEHARSQAEPRCTTLLEVDMRRRVLDGVAFSQICRELVQALPQHVYISVDIDGLDPSLCPSTGTPVPGGLSFAEAEALLLAVARSGRTVVGFDLVEVAPSGREGDEWDANVGARVLYKLCGLALHGHGARD